MQYGNMEELGVDGKRTTFYFVIAPWEQNPFTSLYILIILEPHNNQN